MKRLKGPWPVPIVDSDWEAWDIAIVTAVAGGPDGPHYQDISAYPTERLWKHNPTNIVVDSTGRQFPTFVLNSKVPKMPVVGKVAIPKGAIQAVKDLTRE